MHGNTPPPLEPEESNTISNLRPLSPEFQVGHHEIYARALTSALQNPKIQNIALSGPYGVGKSSILQCLNQPPYARKTIFISLSSLGRKVTTSETTLQRIQKEILKQLIYSQPPSKLPNSRISRIGATHRILTLCIALPITLIVAAQISPLLKNLITIPPFLRPNIWPAGLTNYIIIGVLLATIYKTLQALKSNIQIKNITAGPAKLEIGDHQQSYFDKYLDEIAYFFERTKVNIVVFEDIERFDNTEIFEELRALNTILNARPASQFRQLSAAAFQWLSTHLPQIRTPFRNRSIRFIYAVNDRLFSATGQSTPLHDDTSYENFDVAKNEVGQASRTKFFDIIIPVVPFVTHTSARDILVAELGKENARKIGDLATIAAGHIPDPRLIRNTCNEYLIYRQIILDGDSAALNLSPKQLFAMMLYKAVHLDDYEQIRLGQSDLDAFYHDFVEIIQETSTKLRDRISLEARMAAPLTPESAKLYGEELLSLLAASLPDRGCDLVELRIDNALIDIGEVTTLRFWESLITNSFDVIEGLFITFDNSTDTVVLQRDSIEQTMRLSFEPGAQNRASTAIEQSTKALTLLRTISFASALATLPGAEFAGISPDVIATAANRRLRSQLARDLVRHGFITRDFTLYTGTYHTEHLTANATNFLIHHLRPGVPSYLFELSNQEVRQLIAEVDEQLWKTRGAANCLLVSRLLECIENGQATTKESTTLRSILDAIRSDSDLVESFTATYLSNGALSQEQYVAQIASHNPMLLVQISQLHESSSLKVRLLDRAIANVQSRCEYVTDDSVKSALDSSVEQLQCLSRTDYHMDPYAIVKIFKDCGAPFRNLKTLSDDLQAAALNICCFTVSQANYDYLTTRFTRPSLDVLVKHNADFLPLLLENLSQYLAFTDAAELPALGTLPVDLLNSIVELSDNAVETISRLLRSSQTADWTISDSQTLQSITPSIWPSLADHCRIASDWELIDTYVEQHGMDEHISPIALAVRDASPSDTFSEERRTRLAVHALNCKHLSLNDRITIAALLEQKYWIPLDKIVAESGLYVAKLIEEELIQDDVQVIPFISNLPIAEVPTVLNASKEFLNYLAPSLVSDEVLVAFFESADVANSKKENISQNASNMLGDNVSPRLAQAIANFCATCDIRLSPQTLVWLGRNDAPKADVVLLLVNCLDSITHEDLTSILESLGNPYSQLCRPGTKRPLLPIHASTTTLLNHLKTVNIVSSYTKRGDSYQVFLRRK